MYNALHSYNAPKRNAQFIASGKKDTVSLVRLNIMYTIII